jgi:hypothetical protein
MKRIVRLTESDLTRIVRRVIMEQATSINFFLGDAGNQPMTLTNNVIEGGRPKLTFSTADVKLKKGGTYNWVVTVKCTGIQQADYQLKEKNLTVPGGQNRWMVKDFPYERRKDLEGVVKTYCTK